MPDFAQIFGTSQFAQNLIPPGAPNPWEIPASLMGGLLPNDLSFLQHSATPIPDEINQLLGMGKAPWEIPAGMGIAESGVSGYPDFQELLQLNQATELPYNDPSKVLMRKLMALPPGAGIKHTNSMPDIPPPAQNNTSTLAGLVVLISLINKEE